MVTYQAAARKDVSGAKIRGGHTDSHPLPLSRRARVCVVPLRVSGVEGRLGGGGGGSVLVEFHSPGF